ncbi:lipoma-preferred partner homolog isoform X3 [Episyrphus balteatus]|uniref:lipoma-preferred partner homolog isoform X3 n=1 Tax=Episyrphus balteatus TaxID=286459 RepID=UPI0024867891|nr:lipoma-preferred partner homolog isoform X3 [Episyrphus balteatus]
MDPLDEQLAKLRLINTYPLAPRVYSSSSASPKNFNDASSAVTNPSNPNPTGKCSLNDVSPKKVGPAVPPKPNKKNNFQFPEVPQSMVVKQTCEPLYSKRLQSDSTVVKKSSSSSKQPAIAAGPAILPVLQRKQPSYTSHHIYSNNKVTLDNPDILDQQLEALEHHKRQLQKKGLLQKNKVVVPKLSSASFLNDSSSNGSDVTCAKSYMYSNIKPSRGGGGIGGGELCSSSSSSIDIRRKENDPLNVYSNINHKQQAQAFGAVAGNDNLTTATNNFIYSNVNFENNVDDLPPPPPPPPLEISTALNITDPLEYNNQCSVTDEDIPPPPSPVSSSYSELRRATDIYPKLPSYPMSAYVANASAKTKAGVAAMNNQATAQHAEMSCIEPQQTYMNMAYHNNDYSAYESPSSQGSSTYESIYEPINPRPPSQLSSRSNYLPYTSYVNSPQVSEVDRAAIGVDGVEGNTSLNIIPHLEGSASNGTKLQSHKEAEVEALTDLLVHSMDAGNDVDSFGICVACNERVIGENSGCTAMDQVYHIACFTCSQCQINLQGKPFYALDGKPYCEVDYLNTLEKCSVCMKPILERILRATGKPYHPQCFTCVVCGNSLDGIPFTVDATNQNYCIADFHKKFAPRCCVCKLPIMPEHGQEETVRVVALDRSFHFECYKCEDCGLLLSSEAEGRGCYPLDDHVLCKSCNAKRVQMLTNRMTTEL